MDRPMCPVFHGGTGFNHFERQGCLCWGSPEAFRKQFPSLADTVHLASWSQGAASLRLIAALEEYAWGRVVAAVPSVAFLVAVSMIERRAARRPPGRRSRRAARAGTAVPAPGRGGRGAPRGGAPRRRAPGAARAADHPRRAPRPPRRVQPGRIRAAAPAPRRRGPPAGSRTRRLTSAPRRQRADGRRQVPPLVFSAWDSATWNAATAVVNSGGSTPPAPRPPWSVAPGRRSDGQVVHHRHAHARLPEAFDPPLNLAARWPSEPMGMKPQRPHVDHRRPTLLPPGKKAGP